MGLLKALAVLCGLKKPDSAPEPVPIPTPQFDWLRDYGPLWEPQSAAFWMAPETPAQFDAWVRKYRPEWQGEFTCVSCDGAVLYARVIRIDPDIIPHYSNPYAQAAMQNYQNMLQQTSYQQFMNNQLHQQYSRPLGGLFGGLFK